MDGGVGGMTSPIFSNLPESWSKVSHAARELVTSLSVTFFMLLTHGSYPIGESKFPDYSLTFP